MSEPINDLFASQNEPLQNEPLSVSYVLTSKRYLLRILDVGLITPELVACNTSKEIQVISAKHLPSLSAIEGFPASPVLIQLKQSSDIAGLVISSNAIEAIIFPSNDDREDYLSKAFENVPNELFKLEVAPELFVESSGPVCDFIFPKLDKQELNAKYRKYDMFAGVLSYYLASALNIESVKTSIFNICKTTKEEIFLEDTMQVLITQALDTDVEEKIVAILANYLTILSDYPLDLGWVAKDVLQSLERLYGAADSAGIFTKWLNVSYEIVNNERALIPLTDEKQIVLRAILLHVLNPEQDAIDRMAMKNPAPGSLVVIIASYLATARLGFSAMLAEKKQSMPGAYFMISSLVAAGINNSAIPIEKIQVEKKSDSESILLWENMIVGKYKANNEINTAVNLEEKSKPEYNVEINENDDQIVKANVETHVEIAADLPALSNLTNEISFVSASVIEHESLLITLDKKLLKLKSVSLPKHADFTLHIEDNNLVFETRLLDLTIASHTKKLTGPKMRAMLEYQTEKGRDFCFNLVPDESLKARILLSSINLDSARIEEILNQLIDVQTWMKS
jgi:hypothetical protein